MSKAAMEVQRHVDEARRTREREEKKSPSKARSRALEAPDQEAAASDPVTQEVAQDEGSTQTEEPAHEDPAQGGQETEAPPTQEQTVDTTKKTNGKKSARKAKAKGKAKAAATTSRRQVTGIKYEFLNIRVPKEVKDALAAKRDKDGTSFNEMCEPALRKLAGL